MLSETAKQNKVNNPVTFIPCDFRFEDISVYA